MSEERKYEYLNLINQIIEKGHYKDTWESLAKVPVPQWYQDAKFGIFVHWGVYSVPAFDNEWYPRNMYIEGTPAYEHHLKTYGPQKDFGYADFVPMFKAEKFDPAIWADLFKESGARYVMPVAEHHDGFQMYDSEFSDWNAARKGPQRDVLGELKTEIEDRDMMFAASSHRAENFWFFGGGRSFDSGISDITYQEPYGYADPAYALGQLQVHEGTHNIYSTPATVEHLEDWLVRTCELVDKYEPKVVWFDWWIQNMSFKPYLKKFAAYYNNRALEWGTEVAINYKFDAYLYGSAVFDVERGQLKNIRPEFWQTDTAIAKNSWSHTENNDYKHPEDIVGDLVDIVSKNGCMLLNVGPKADGSITDEDRLVLEGIGKWMTVNGEAIYDTRHWVCYGEGPTEVAEGAFTDVNRKPFTCEDIRFTFKAPYLYAISLQAPIAGQLLNIRTLSKKSHVFKGHIGSVELLGFDNRIYWQQTDEGLSIEIFGTLETEYPICFKIELG